MDLGLLVARLVLGPLMAAHGAQKLFGWFGGHGLSGTSGLFESLGFRPGRLFALAAGLAEVGSGILVTLGWLGPVGPALMLSVMTVAIFGVHWRHGIFAMSNGIEVPLLYAAGAVALAFTGHGAWSVDRLLGASLLWSPAMNAAAIVVGVLGGVANLALRRTADPVGA